MSLFQAKDWWHNNADEHVGNHALAITPQNLLITATHKGIVRLFHPKAKDYAPDHLALEQSVQLPVLALALGSFLADNAAAATVALLHPRSLTVHELVEPADAAPRGGGGARHGSAPGYHALAQMYGLELERPCCNMACGPFGGADSRTDGICVQSMDGVLSIVENERVARERQLTKFLLPGPLHYSKASDSFFTTNAQLEVDCYRYSTLSALVPAGGGGAAADGVGGYERVKPDWSATVGEDVVCIATGRASTGLARHQEDIIVIAERTMSVLHTDGALRTQLRLHYVPSCCHLQPTPGADGPDCNLLVGSRTGSVMVYRDFRLAWAARLPAAAASLGVGTFGGVRGLLASLSYSGALTLSYFGTEPAQATAPTETRALDYEAMEAEHRTLLQSIRDASSGAGRREPDDALTLSARVARATGAGAAEHWPLEVIVTVTNPGPPLRDVNLVAACVAPFFLASDSVNLPSLAGAGAVINVPFTFRARADVLPVDTRAEVVASYASAAGTVQSARVSFSLPLCMVAQVCPLVKLAKYKITLEAGGAAVPPLLELFRDVPEEAPGVVAALEASGGAPAISLKYNCGLEVTMLLSKSAGRLRIQSDAFEGIWLLASELVARLARNGNGAGGGGRLPAGLTFTEPVPLVEYFEAIDDHLRCRFGLDAVVADLEKCAHQMRVIEKRLLVRLKDRNPAPLANLELLCEGTHAQLLDLAGAADDARAALRFHSTRLAAATRLVLLLLHVRNGLTDEEADVLEAHLSPLDADATEQGWEERTAAALAHLLRTSLSKSGGGGGEVGVSNSFDLSRPADAEKLKKQLGVLVDRLERGLRPKAC